jgi:hypothetical protein
MQKAGKFGDDIVAAAVERAAASVFPAQILEEIIGREVPDQAEAWAIGNRSIGGEGESAIIIPDRLSVRAHRETELRSSDSGKESCKK